MNIFLTVQEKENLAKWKYSVEDRSITTQLFKPLWNYLATFFPEIVTPNMITVSGLICILYAYHLCMNYIDFYPVLISVVCVFFTLMYFFLDAIDGICARGNFVMFGTKNKRLPMASPLGELVDHSADNVGSTFLMLTLCVCLGIKDHLLQWYFVQTAQLIFLDCHLTAFRDRVVKFGKFIGGPGEFLMVYCLTILWSAFIGFESFSSLIHPVVYLLGISPIELGKVSVMLIYYVVFGYIFYKSATLKDHYASRNGLMLSLFARFIPSILIYIGLGSGELSTYTIISHGLVMSVLVGDIIVSKMASRELHPLVPIMIMLSLFDNFICILICILYYGIMLTEISMYMRIPLIGRYVNVFCNGVYDLCHVGHMNIFRVAASYGTRLIVGVHNDEDVESYKRKPTMNHKERCDAVSKQKFVDQVIPNCPLNLTKEFIKQHNIHIVVCSEEYDKPDDEYYRAARELGILRVLPRTEGISTTDLRNRIKEGVEKKIT